MNGITLKNMRKLARTNYLVSNKRTLMKVTQNIINSNPVVPVYKTTLSTLDKIMYSKGYFTSTSKAEEYDRNNNNTEYKDKNDDPGTAECTDHVHVTIKDKEMHERTDPDCKTTGPQTNPANHGGNDLDDIDDLYGMKANDKNVSGNDSHDPDGLHGKESVQKTRRTATSDEFNDDHDDDLYGMKPSNEPKGDTFLSLSDSESNSGQDKFSTAEESGNDDPEEIIVKHIEWQHVWAIDPWDWRPAITPRKGTIPHPWDP